MRRNLKVSVLLAASVVAGAVAGMGPASAREGIQDRYCLQGRNSGYPGNCQFSTYRQCMATASGTFDTCGLNPMAAYAPQRSSEYRYRY